VPPPPPAPPAAEEGAAGEEEAAAAGEAAPEAEAAAAAPEGEAEAGAEGETEAAGAEAAPPPEKVPVGAVAKLSEDFVQELFDAVRFPLLSHDQLLQAGRKAYVPKDNIVDAMSARLNPYEEAESAHLEETQPRLPPGADFDPNETMRPGELGDDSMAASRGRQNKAPAARGFGEDPASPGGGRDVHICNYVSDFDRNGILYYVGSNFGNSVWSNPSAKGRVCVLASSCGHGEPHDLVGRTIANFRTKDEEGAWSIVDFGEKRRAHVTHYTLMARQFKSHYPRAWVLEGSVDGSKWLPMSTHEEDDALAGGGGTTKTWILPNTDSADATGAMRAAGVNQLPESFVRFVRLRQTGPNSSGSFNLMLSCMEFYGLLYSE